MFNLDLTWINRFFKENAYFRLPVNLTGARRDRYISNGHKPSVNKEIEYTQTYNSYGMNGYS